MKILFLSLLDFETIEEHNIYTDLLREFRKEKHELYIVSPVERRKKKKTYVIQEDGCKILKLCIGNIQKTNYFEKGFSLLRLQGQFIKGITTYFSDVKIDLILYATPPITFSKVVAYIKKRDQAISYLLLKDIWPQGIVDLGVISKKGLIYRYFRKKEKDMYKVSDYIGCMSLANVRYILEENSFLKADKVEVCPNSIEPVLLQEISELNINQMKKKYEIPQNKTIFLYGGNLGRPQGLDFLLQIIEKCEDNEAFFLIVGDGTEYERIDNYLKSIKAENVRLIKYLPKTEFEKLVQISDVGLVFLDRRFTVPNIPSRILSYMQAGIPILAATDLATDLREIIENNEMGYWCENGDLQMFFSDMKKLKEIKKRKKMGENGRKCLEEKYSVAKGYQIIEKHQ
jgi:glycosyltransferase involved in cell wall biosynthesis